MKNPLLRKNSFFGLLFILLPFFFSESISAFQLNWSDPATWNGVKPVSGDIVTIPEGTTIILDEHSPDLAGLTINGTLIFGDQDLNLSSDWIFVTGTFRIGSVETPYTNQAIITLTGTDTEQDIMGMGTRGIMVMGGTLEFHGSAPSVAWTKVNAHAEQATTSLTLSETVDWQTGDEIIIAPTDYYEAGNGTSVTEKRVITSASGTSVSLSEGLNAFHWGLLQYATYDGMSLTATNLIVPSVPDTGEFHTPVILDQRAAVGNLSRNIRIQAPNDELWETQGFGVHIMVMGDNASARLDGIEIQRGGQTGRIRRYPIHWHMLSYSGTETLDDATGQYMINSVVNESGNRGIVIHGTNGLLIQNNIVYDILGHGIFTEDAVERRNVIDGNLVLHIRNQLPQNALKQHETGQRGASAFWLSNPDNTIINNHAADAQTNGFWLAFPFQPWGESINVLHEDGLLLNPSRLLFGVFDNNTTHSNRLEGIMLDESEIDNEGNTGGSLQYQSTTNGRPISWPFDTLRRFQLTRYNTWKNGSSGIWDRGAWPDNFSVVSADNVGRFFAGSGADGLIERSLVVGTSLNYGTNGTGRVQFEDVLGNTEAPAAFATYHSAFDIKNNIVVNFPMVPNKRSGAFATEDYYLRPVDKGQVRNVGNILIESHPGVRLEAPFNYFVLAGALWDPNKNWGGDIENGYLVYNTPFFTYGQTPYQPAPGPEMGGVTVEGPFYGFNAFILNLENLAWEDLMAISVKRYNNSFEEVGTWDINGIWSTTELFAHMRHFAAHPSGYYELQFPEEDEVSDIAFSVENMLTKQDTLVLAIEYSGEFQIDQVYTSSYGDFLDPNHAEWPTSFNLKHVYVPVESRDDVIQSNGEVYWHDTENDLVWVKILGGIGQPWNDADYKETDDQLLYRKFNFRVYGSPLPTNTDSDEDLPTSFKLYQNFPNPFNPSTNIRIDLPESSSLKLEIFDITGRVITSIFEGNKRAGTHTFLWDASNYSSGIYFLNVQMDGKHYVKKMSLLK